MKTGVRRFSWTFAMNSSCQLDGHAQAFTLMRAEEDWELDQTNVLIDFLLRSALLPSFAFPLDVCTLLCSMRGPVWKWGERYKPSTDMRQAPQHVRSRTGNGD